MGGWGDVGGIWIKIEEIKELVDVVKGERELRGRSCEKGDGEYLCGMWGYLYSEIGEFDDVEVGGRLVGGLEWIDGRRIDEWLVDRKEGDKNDLCLKGRCKDGRMRGFEGLFDLDMGCWGEVLEGMFIGVWKFVRMGRMGKLLFEIVCCNVMGVWRRRGCRKDGVGVLVEEVVKGRWWILEEGMWGELIGRVVGLNVFDELWNRGGWLG
ncbi:hypothetical protein Tco_0185547 [Tanacetum coccineum]